MITCLRKKSSSVIIPRFLWSHVVKFSSVTHSYLILCDPMDCSTPGLSVDHQLSNSRPLSRWCHPTISSSVIPFSSCLHFPSIRVFSDESVLCIRWPKYWSFSFSISPSNEYSGLISFRMDWLDLVAVQGTLKSLLQHHSSKASILRHSAFFIVQLSYHTWLLEKTIVLTWWTFVGKVILYLCFLICCLGWS